MKENCQEKYKERRALPSDTNYYEHNSLRIVVGNSGCFSRTFRLQHFLDIPFVSNQESEPEPFFRNRAAL